MTYNDTGDFFMLHSCKRIRLIPNEFYFVAAARRDMACNLIRAISIRYKQVKYFIWKHKQVTPYVYILFSVQGQLVT